MSIIHVRHIKAAVEKRFRDLVDLSDLPNSPPAHREDCFLTRGLAAFVIAELTGALDKIAAASIVDEFGDNGIDALYYDAPEQVCYLVQSKWIKSGTGSVDL
jgi:hypothetical protein